jgi:hypothetical protein
MKTYEVELRCTTYLAVTVEAESQDEAETLAWQEVEAKDLTFDLVEVESIEETTGESNENL